MSAATDASLEARRTVRRHGRRLLTHSKDVGAHLGRLHASLELPGSEPVQGVLADLFTVFGAGEAELKRTALRLAHGRLPGHVARWFEGRVALGPLSRISSLATRWSVLASPSANMSTRARRCSADDSRLLADQAVAAWRRGDLEAQEEFFHHCLTCRDNLAFMLARRALLRDSPELPASWQTLSEQLEHMQEDAS